MIGLLLAGVFTQPQSSGDRVLCWVFTIGMGALLLCVIGMLLSVLFRR